MTFESVEPASAAPGDAIEFRGRFGPLTPYKLVRMNHRKTSELTVLSWSEKIIRVRLPPGLPEGARWIGIDCYWGRGSLPAGGKVQVTAPSFRRPVAPAPEPPEPKGPARSFPPDLAPEERGPALLGAAMVHSHADRREEAFHLTSQAVAAYEAAGDQAGRAEALLMRYYFGDLLGREDAFGDLQASLRTFRRALAELPQDADRRSVEWPYTDTLYYMAQERMKRDELEEARALMEEAHRIREGLGSGWGLAVPEQVLGEIALRQGKLEEAARRFEAAAKHNAESNNQLGADHYRKKAVDARRQAERLKRFGQPEAPDPP